MNDDIYEPPFELDDISILPKHFQHKYPQYEIPVIEDIDIGDDL